METNELHPLCDFHSNKKPGVTANLTTFKEFGTDGEAYERISNMTCYLSSSLFSMHFGHGTMSQIVCIQVVFFGRNFATKKGPCPKYRGFFVKKLALCCYIMRTCLFFEVTILRQ
jgi:hypothetical protein